MIAIRYVLVAFLSAVPMIARGQEAPAPDFNGAIAPVFQKYCVACHSADMAEGGLVLDSYESLLKGGKRGAAIVAGRSDQSRLILALEGKVQPAMPPEGNEPPAADEVALLKSWIDAGANSPTGAPPDPTLLITPAVPPRVAARRPINSVAVSPDGTLYAMAGHGEVRLVSSETRATVRVLAGHRGPVNIVSFSADGSKLMAAGGEPGLFGEARLWSVADGSPIRTFTGHKDCLYAAALSADGRLLATGSYDQKIKIWDVESGSELRTLTGHNGAVYEVAFSLDARLLASASGDRSVKLWDVESGTRLDTFAQSTLELYSVAFSPDGSRIAAGGVDNRIRVWTLSESAAEGTNPLAISKFAHQGAILKLVFSPDGQTLASSAEDRSIKIWNAETIEEQQVVASQPDSTPALAFSPDSRLLLAGRLDGSTTLYDSTTGQVVPPPQPELAQLEPRTVQRGVATRIRLVGKNLSEATGISAGDPALTATIVASTEAKADELLVDVTPAAELRRGTYTIAVVTPGGTSGTLSLSVDDLPQVAEIEPNDTPIHATAAALPVAFHGTLAAQGDIDSFAFDLAAGQTVVFELNAQRQGSKANGVLTLFDPAGHVAAGNNDFDGQADPFLAYTAPVAGRYSVRVNDLQMAGSPEHHYQLSVGSFPFVTGSFPLSVPANAESTISLAGYNLPSNATVQVASGAGGDVPVAVDAERFRQRRPLSVVAGNLAETVETEPNDSPDQATTVTAPGSVGGRIFAADPASPPDADLFRFEAKAGQSWIVETDAARRGSPIDTKIEIQDAAGVPLERALLQAVRDSYIDFRSIDSSNPDVRLKNWEEMQLNQYLYLSGEVAKLFRAPQGPDSGFLLYTVGGKRRCYLDTSATAHAVYDNCYIVEAHPPGAAIVANGLPVFPIHYANDDDGERKLGSDSRLTFTAPADGSYLVRVSDVRGAGGDRYAYRLTIREPRPDFTVSLAGADPQIPAGSGKAITLNAERLDGFEGPIAVAIEGLPPGFSVSSPVIIEAGHSEAKVVLSAAADAPTPTDENAATTKVSATAEIGGQAVVKDVNNLGRIQLAAKGQVIVSLEPEELSIVPGTTIPAMLKVERNEYGDLVSFDVFNLPHGVIVDNIGLSGVLVRAGETERQVFITAAPWVPDTTRQVFANTREVGNQASRPVTFHVRRPAEVAQQGGE